MVYNRRYNYPNRKPLPHDKEPNIKNIQYLSIVDKPFTLVGVTIKNIVSVYEYEQMKLSCKLRANGNCEICGKLVPKGEDLRDNIVCYEAFKYDFNTKVVKFMGLLGVCWHCYLMLNPYLQSKEVDSHYLNARKLSAIVKKRRQLLEFVGFKSIELNRGDVFVLEYRGYKYINDFYPQILERALSRGVRVLRCPFVEQCMASDYYWHKP